MGPAAPPPCRPYQLTRALATRRRPPCHAQRDGQHARRQHDNGTFIKALQYANTCHQCRADVPAGSAGWYNKEAESGQRITCEACHAKQLGDAEAAGADGDGAHGAPDEAQPKRAAKKRAPQPKVDEAVLRGPDGLRKLYSIASAKGALKRSRDEAKDLRRILGLYKEWAHKMVPAMDFGVILERTEKAGGHKRVRVRAHARTRTRARRHLATADRPHRSRAHARPRARRRAARRSISSSCGTSRRATARWRSWTSCPVTRGSAARMRTTIWASATRTRRTSTRAPSAGRAGARATAATAAAAAA